MTKSLHLGLALASSDFETYDGAVVYGNDLQKTVVEVRPRERTMTRIGEIPGQLIGYLAPGERGLGFVSFTLAADLFVRREGGMHAVTTDGHTWEAAPCGSHGFLLARKTSGYQSMEIIRLHEDGTMTVVANRGGYGAPACDRTGRTWWYGHGEFGRQGFVRCTAEGCSELGTPGVLAAHLSPDETRLVFLAYSVEGARVRWMAATGGPVHDVADSETICAPGWASNTTLWISRKHRDSLYWTEVDANTGEETGHRVPGGHDCNDTDPDPLSPIDPDMRVIPTRVSQIRWKRNDGQPNP